MLAPGEGVEPSACHHRWFRGRLRRALRVDSRLFTIRFIVFTQNTSPFEFGYFMYIPPTFVPFLVGKGLSVVMFGKSPCSFRRILIEPVEEDRTVDSSEEFAVSAFFGIVREDLEILDREIEILIPDQSRRIDYLCLIHRIGHIEEIDQVVEYHHQCRHDLSLAVLLSDPDQRNRVRQSDNVIDPPYRQSQIRQPQRIFPILRGQLVFRPPLPHDSRYRSRFFGHNTPG